MITEEDKVMLKYFWDKKRDIRVYSRYKAIEDELESDYPDLMSAFFDYRSSGNVVDLLLNRM